MPSLRLVPSDGSHTTAQVTIRSTSDNALLEVRLLWSSLFLFLHAHTGIRVSNTPGAVDDATATTALFLIISCLRHFAWGERSAREGTWKVPISSARTHDITGRTLGILGLGGIGLRLAHLVHVFPMRVIYYSRRKVAHAPEWCEYVGSMDELLRQSDVLSLHVPLRPDTVHLVGEKEIRAMKKGSVIVNTARGKVIDEEAMIRALEDGHVSGSFYIFIRRPCVINSGDFL